VLGRSKNTGYTRKKRQKEMDDYYNENQHQYARDSDGNWVNACKETKRNTEYFCSCPDKHKLKFVTPSNDPDKRPFRPYFAHISTRKGGAPCCQTCAESQTHVNAKHVLREKFGEYRFLLSKCPNCKHRHVYWNAPKNGKVELEVRSVNGKWRYDCMVVVDGQKVMALEVCHTHKTEHRKIADTRSHGLEIAEFDADDILSLNHEKSILRNLLMKSTVCPDCKCVEHQRLAREIREHAIREAAMAHEEAQRKAREAQVEAQIRAKVEENRLRDHLEFERQKTMMVEKYQAQQKAEEVIMLANRKANENRIPGVPSESIDFTPPELWPIIWEHYPGGIEMPSAIPRYAWEKNWREWHPEEAKLGKSAPEAPALLKCYWGKLRDRALVSRRAAKRAKVDQAPPAAGKKAPQRRPQQARAPPKKEEPDIPEEPLPPVLPPRLSDAFWQDYFRIFPEGHGAPGYSSSGFKSAGEPGKPYEDPTLYKLIRGSLHVMANGVWRPSTGVDAWDKNGKWIGPG
jgi:hypothetical protein